MIHISSIQQGLMTIQSNGTQNFLHIDQKWIISSDHDKILINPYSYHKSYNPLYIFIIWKDHYESLRMI